MFRTVKNLMQGLKKFDLLDLTYSTKVTFPFAHFFQKNQKTTCSYREKCIYIELKQFSLNIFCKFEQSGYSWINKKTWFFFLVLLYNSEVSDSEFVRKNQACDDGEIRRWGLT